MDFLKKGLAPISDLAWQEIEGRAREVLETQLTARRFVRVNGPIGKEKGGVPVGRLEVKECDGVHYGIHQIQPFIENRISFTLNRWELDNLERGAKDIDFTPLDEAVKKAAKFEEKTIYKGLDEACVLGLLESNKEAIEFGTTEAETIKNIMYGVSKLRNTGYNKGPFVLVVGLEKYIYLNMINPNDSLAKKLEGILGMPIIISHNITEGILLPYDNENIELTLGEDFSIGFQEHDEKDVKLFVTETFTFRVLDKDLVVTYK